MPAVRACNIRLTDLSVLWQGCPWQTACMSWQARELLGVRAVPAAERDIVAYLPRGDAGSAGVFNGGRRVADEDALLDGLAALLETRPERLEARGRFTSPFQQKNKFPRSGRRWDS